MHFFFFSIDSMTNDPTYCAINNKKKKLLPYVSYHILELNLQQLQGGREGGREERREGGKT